MKNIEEKILIANEEIKRYKTRKKLISQQKQEERKKEIKGYEKGQSLKVCY